MGHLKARCSWADHSVKQLNLKEPFGFGPWMKAETINKRTTQWVELLAESDQSKDEEEEEERGRQLQLELDVHREHALGVASTKVRSAISPLAKVDVSEDCQTNFENSEAHVPSKQLSLEKLPDIHTQSQPDIQPKNKNQNIFDQPLLLTASNTFTPMETDLQDETNLTIPIQTQPCTISQEKINSINPSDNQEINLQLDHEPIPEEPKLIQDSASPSNNLQNTLSDQNLMDPSLFIELSKAHNNRLSWTAYYMKEKNRAQVIQLCGLL